MAWKYLEGGDLFFFLWRSTSLGATLHELWRLFPGKVVISKWKMACGPQQNSQHAMLPAETREFDSPDLMQIYQRKNHYFDLKFISTAI